MKAIRFWFAWHLSGLIPGMAAWDEPAPKSVPALPAGHCATGAINSTRLGGFGGFGSVALADDSASLQCELTLPAPPALASQHNRRLPMAIRASANSSDDNGSGIATNAQQAIHQVPAPGVEYLPSLQEIPGQRERARQL